MKKNITLIISGFVLLCGAFLWSNKRAYIRTPHGGDVMIALDQDEANLELDHMKQLVAEKTGISPEDQIITFVGPEESERRINIDEDLQKIVQTIQTGYEFRFKVEEKSAQEKQKNAANKQQCSPIYNEVKKLQHDRDHFGLSKHSMKERLKHMNNNSELKALANSCARVTQQLQTLEKAAPNLSRRAIDKRIDSIIGENGNDAINVKQ